MKLFLLLSSVVSFIISFIFSFCLIGYKFSGILLFLVGAFLLYLALSIGIKKRALKLIRRIVIVLAALAFLFCAIMTGAVVSEMGGDAEIGCDYVIVLGAGLDGEVPSLTLSDRLQETLLYMNTFPDSIAVVSGGQGSGEAITEALAMERYLIAHGISPERIIREEAATTTNENLKFSKEIITSRGGGSIAIVSSDYHIFRARRLAKKQGISATMVSAKTSLPVLCANYTLREGFALLKAGLLGHI